MNRKVNNESENLENDELDEGKGGSSFGDPSKTALPVDGAGGKVKKRRGDQSGKLDAHQPPNPNTKVGVINAVVNKIAEMNREDLSDLYRKIVDESFDSDDEINDEEEVVVNAVNKITTDDIDVSEEIEALTKGDDLTEEQKDRIKTVFETLVVKKVNEQLETISSIVQEDANSAADGMLDELSEKINDYLDYVVEEWASENKLAIQQGVKADMVEDFLVGLKGLFEEHYVDIPEDKIDVVEELASKVEELERKLSEETDEVVELRSMIKEFEKDRVFAESTEDLTDTQADKLASLVENVTYNDEADFRKRINILKEQYFDVESSQSHLVEDDSTDEVTALNEEDNKPTNQNMSRYVTAISKHAKAR